MENLRSISIEHLPVELFHSVILLSLPDYYQHEDIFCYYRQLSSFQLVSSSWSKAAVSCASAWTKLSSSLPLQALEQILDRSRNQLLEVECYAENHMPGWEDDQNQFLDKLKPFSPRWKVLDIQSNDDADFVSCLQGLVLPNLTELRITGALIFGLESRSIRIDNHLPKLSVLKASGVYPELYQTALANSATTVPVLSIQHLDLDFVAVGQTSRLSFPHLTSLAITEDIILTFNIAFLENIDTPRLKNFSFTTFPARTNLVPIGMLAGRCLANSPPQQIASQDVLHVEFTHSELRIQYGGHWVEICNHSTERSKQLELWSSVFEQIAGKPCSRAPHLRLRPTNTSKPSTFMDIAARNCPVIKQVDVILTSTQEADTIEVRPDTARATFHDVASYLGQPSTMGIWPFRYMERLHIGLVPELTRVPWGVRMTKKGYYVNHEGMPVDICFFNELVGIVRSRKLCEPETTAIRGIKAAFGRMSREAKRELEDLVSDVELFAVTIAGSEGGTIPNW